MCIETMPRTKYESKCPCPIAHEDKDDRGLVAGDVLEEFDEGEDEKEGLERERGYPEIDAELHGTTSQ